MAKSDRARSARERAAEMRAAQQKQDRKKKQTWTIGIVVLVVVLIAGLVAIGLTHKSKPSTSSTASPRTTAAASVVSDVKGVPQSTLNAVGAGTISNPPKSIGTTVTLTADGKPRVLYVGAEYCPYCAAERWAVVQALSRFGTWKALGATESAGGSEAYPNTKTLSFHGATFTSDYLSFTGIEQKTNVANAAGNDYGSLDKISSTDKKILDTFDAPPYVPSSSAGSIPFMSIGGKWLVSGASYDPAVLKGLTYDEIATKMQTPDNDVSQAVNGSANVIAAAICSITANAPASVCSTPAVTAGATKLTKS